MSKPSAFARLHLLFLTLSLQVPALCQADDFDGIWRSLGYGQVLEISGETVVVYQEVGGQVLRSTVERAHREGTRFEFECYDLGHLYNLAYFVDLGAIKPPFFIIGNNCS